MGLVDEDFNSTFEIIGIFTHDQPILPGTSNFDYCYPYENPDNMILMPSTSAYLAILPISQKSFDYQASLWPDDEYYTEENRPSEEKMLESLYIDNVTLLLSDPLDVDKFVEDYMTSLKETVLYSSFTLPLSILARSRRFSTSPRI